MKLAAIFTVFNGTELLRGAIEQIYPYVDRILISYQNISNRGETDSSMPHRFNDIISKGKIYTLKFEPDLNQSTKENERRKLNAAIQDIKRNNFTHFILLACDHYYLGKEFLDAKIKADKYDVTLTNMYTYFKNPEWQLTPIENYQMPFICRIYPNTEVSMQEYKGFRTDPSVRISTRNKVYCFTESEIMLHHYSMVRNDIADKFNNAAASIIWKPEMLMTYYSEYNDYDIEKNPGVTYFKGRKIKVVPNYFKIPLKSESPHPKSFSEGEGLLPSPEERGWG